MTFDPRVLKHGLLIYGEYGKRRFDSIYSPREPHTLKICAQLQAFALSNMLD